MAEKQKFRDYPATRHRLWQLFHHNNISEDAWDRSQEIAGFVPDRDDWLRFIDLLVLALGTIFLVAGILFFFAFNWADLSKFAKFAIVEGAVVIATILAFVFNLDKWAGRMSLAAASILIGVALGVVGTTYQTGADSYNLFMVWTMLVTGWMLISRWNIMYLIWMILLNITISLYWYQVVDTQGDTLNLILLFVNFGFIILWDLLAHFNVFEFMRRGRWFLYFLMIPVTVYASYLMLEFIFDFGTEFVTLGWIAPFAYVALIIVSLLMYTGLKRDLLMLTMVALSLLVVVVSAAGRILAEVLLNEVADPYFFFCLMGLITVGTTGALVVGLRRLQRRWEIES